MELYTVSDDEPVWLEFKDADDTFERLRVSRDDVRRKGVLGRVPARKPADDAERPDFEFYAWSRAKFEALSRFFERKGDIEVVMHGSYLHALSHRDPQHRRPLRALFVREGGVVEIKGLQSGYFDYAAVLHIRKWVLLLPLALCALLLCLSLSLCSPSTPPDFLSGMTGTAGATSRPVVSVDYAAYDATVDSVWKADTLTQDFTLSLPATCQYAKGKEGGNPIISSPSIMVDLNHDSKYSDNECVYNPAGKTGYGAFLRPGTEVNRIKLTQSVPAGTYSARTVWRSVLASDGKTPASSTSFDFNLTVE